MAAVDTPRLPHVKILTVRPKDCLDFPKKLQGFAKIPEFTTMGAFIVSTIIYFCVVGLLKWLFSKIPLDSAYYHNMLLYESSNRAFTRPTDWGFN
jgi:hypothetical protein